MATEIKDVVALVTGGSSGIGKCVSEMIVANGGKVVIVDLNDAGIDVVKELGSENALFVHGNVVSEKDIEDALKQVKAKFGRLNVVINNAGIIGGEPFYDFETDTPHSMETLRKIYEVNTFGVFNVMRLAVKLMKENQPDDDKQRGVIINIGSVTGFGVADSIVAYSTSKAAVMAMTEPVARSLASVGIRVVCVAPGFSDTRLLGGIPEEEKEFYINETMNPVRAGKPSEITHLIKCLIENHFINAEIIRIDAGHRACNKKCNPRRL